MFKKKNTPPANPIQNVSRDADTPKRKYPRPKILLADMGAETQQLLSAEGYNVADGTFGVPYKVPMSSSYSPVIPEYSLPNYAEQEVVVVDLVPADPIDNPEGEKRTPEDEKDWWASCRTGVIDPRPRAMVGACKLFDRILATGGVFVVFADDRDRQKFVWAASSRYRGLEIHQELHYDNWSFLSVLSRLQTRSEHGEEIVVANKEWPLCQLLQQHLKGAMFCCTFAPEWPIDKDWLTLASNKYGAPVAGVIRPKEEERTGWVFVFPRITRKDEFVLAMLAEILPAIVPKLFPHVEGARWVQRPDYELHTVLQLQKDIRATRELADSQVADLESAIVAARKDAAYIYDLIRETGRPLVEAVMKALGVLGFKSVIDVDAQIKEEAAKGEKSKTLREDLQIHDQLPT